MYYRMGDQCYQHHKILTNKNVVVDDREGTTGGGRDLHLPVKLTVINIPDQWYVAIYNTAIEGFIAHFINCKSLVTRSWPSFFTIL